MEPMYTSTVGVALQDYRLNVVAEHLARYAPEGGERVLVAADLIDKSDAFVFGYSKLDVMFGRSNLDAVRLPYRNL